MATDLELAEWRGHVTQQLVDIDRRLDEHGRALGVGIAEIKRLLEFHVADDRRTFDGHALRLTDVEKKYSSLWSKVAAMIAVSTVLGAAVAQAVAHRLMQ